LVFKVLLKKKFGAGYRGTAVIPALERLRQEDLRFKTGLSCTVRLSQNSNKVEKERLTCNLSKA
jgi:hypothetical protein